MTTPTDAAELTNAESVQYTVDDYSAQHFSSLVGLFSTVFASTLVIVAIVDFLRGPTGALNTIVSSTSLVLHAKSWDHLMFAVSVALCIVLAIVFVRYRPIPPRWVIPATIAATVGVTVGIFSIEEPDLEKYYYYWSGFGLGALIFVVVLAPFVWRLFEWRSLRRSIRALITVVLGVICASDAMVLYRPIYSVLDPLNDIYMLNEMLAPAAGKAPDAQFIPTYDVLYGWVLKPFAGHVSVTALTVAACVMLSIFSILAIGFCVLLAHRVLGRRSWALAAALVIPLACVQIEHYPLVSVAAEYQDYPIRLFPVMLLAVFAIEELIKVRRQIIRPIRLVAIGFLAGLVAWNNHDFGITSVLVFAAMFLVASTRRLGGTRTSAYFFGGLAGGVVIYPLILAIAGSPISLSYLFHFQLTFAEGFLAYPVQIPGPVMVVMPLILATAAVGWYTMWTRRQPSFVRDDDDLFVERASVTATFFGTWMLVALVYYLNRSIAAGQLQVYLPPCGVAIASLIALSLRPILAHRDAMAFSGWHMRTQPVARKWLNRLALVPLSMIVALPFSAILDSPYPNRVIDALRSPPAGTSFVWPSVSGIQAEAAIASAARTSIAYYGDWGNYVQLATGVRSVSLVNYPPVGTALPGGLECQYVDHFKEQLLITDTNTAAAFGNKVICGDYYATSNNAAAPYLIFHRGHLPTTSAATLLNRAALATSAGNFAAAANDYNYLLADHPEDLTALFDLGALYQLDDHSCTGAIGEYDRALELDPNDVAVLFNLAQCQTTGNLPTEIALYQQVVDLSPKYALAYLDLGRAEIEEGETTEGNANLQTAYRLNPSLK